MLRALRSTGLLIWVTVLFVSMLSHPFLVCVRASRWLSAGLAVLLLHAAVTGLCMLLRWYSRAWVTITGVLLFAGVGLMLPYRSHIDPSNLWAPGYWALPWVTLVMMVLPRRRYIPVMLSVFPALLVVDLAVQWLVGAPITRVSLEPVPGLVSPVALMVLFYDGLLELARTSDRHTARRQRAESQRSAQHIESEGRREAARLLHDHVLHALHALSRDTPHLTNQMVVDECRTAVEAVSSVGDEAPTTLLEQLFDEDQLLNRDPVTVLGTSGPLPTHVARAMADATHEAVSNVQQHARATVCQVRIRQRGDQWSCSITDDGVGFDPTQLPSGRLGVRASITDRMAEVGGDARVSSSPGRGTRVELTWPALADLDDQLPEHDPREVRQVLTRTAWPNLFLAPVFTAMLYPLVHPWWAVVLATAALLVVGLTYSIRVGTHPMTDLDTVLVLTTSLAAWATNLWCAPDGVTVIHYLWLAWGCAALAHLVVMQTTPRRGAVLLLGWGGAMVTLMLVRFNGHVEWATMHPVVSVGMAEGLISLLAYHSGRRISAADAQQRHDTELLRRTTLRMQARTHLDQFWSRRVTGEALPLLQEVASGARCPDDPATRRLAQHVEATLRDELVLGPSHPCLLGALADLRHRGWQVRSTLTSENDPDQLRAVAMVLDVIGPPAQPGQTITLSGAGERATVVVLSPSPEQGERWAREFGDDLVFDPDFARIQVSCAARPVVLARSAVTNAV